MPTVSHGAMPLRTNPESEESHKRDRKNAANHQNKPEQKEQSGGASIIPAFPAKCFKLTNQISVSTSAQKRQNLTSIIWGQGYTVAECTLIPSPHPDLFSQLWRKKKGYFSLRLRDKIWLGTKLHCPDQPAENQNIGAPGIHPLSLPNPREWGKDKERPMKGCSFRNNLLYSPEVCD